MVSQGNAVEEGEEEEEEKKKKDVRGDLLRLRALVTRELFAELPSDVQLEWKAKAKADHVEALETWSAAGNVKPSTAPADRQK